MEQQQSPIIKQLARQLLELEAAVVHRKLQSRPENANEGRFAHSGLPGSGAPTTGTSATSPAITTAGQQRAPWRPGGNISSGRSKPEPELISGKPSSRQGSPERCSQRLGADQIPATSTFKAYPSPRGSFQLTPPASSMPGSPRHHRSSTAGASRSPSPSTRAQTSASGSKRSSSPCRSSTSPYRGTSPLRSFITAVAGTWSHSGAEIHRPAAGQAHSSRGTSPCRSVSTSCAGASSSVPYHQLLQDAYSPTAVPAAVRSPALKEQAARALRTSAGQLQHGRSRRSSAGSPASTAKPMLPARQHSKNIAVFLQPGSHAGYTGSPKGSATATAPATTVASSSMGAAVIAAAVAAMVGSSCSCRTSDDARQVSTAATASEDALKGYTSGYIDGRLAAFRTGNSSSGGGASGSWGSMMVSSSGGASAQAAQLSRRSSTSALDTAQEPCAELHCSTAVTEQQPLVSVHTEGKSMRAMHWKTALILCIGCNGTTAEPHAWSSVSIWPASMCCSLPEQSTANPFCLRACCLPA